MTPAPRHSTSSSRVCPWHAHPKPTCDVPHAHPPCAQGQAGQSDAASKPEAQELPQAAADTLLQLYREKAPDKVYLVEALLKRQGLL